MKYAIKILGYATGDPCKFVGLFVEAFDPDAENGRGAVAFAKVERHAKTFESMEDAFAFWNTVSTVRPLRDDGKPNKPLTSFSVDVVGLEASTGPRTNRP